MGWTYKNRGISVT